MELFYATDFQFSAWLIRHALGVLYLLAFVNAWNQFRPLCGEYGLLPAPLFLEQVSFRKTPSLFHRHYSDRFFGGVCGTGILLSLSVISGIALQGPVWISVAIWLLLWVLYQSIVNIGQLFYGFGWESMLLELGFYAIFLGNAETAAPVATIWMIRWMLFRVEFGAGLIKIRGDQCWRDLTCLNYHHETQPLPNPLSRFFHLQPEWIHKAETFFNHTVQLVIIWGIFLPQPISTFCALIVMGSQFYLIVSGNYSWLNWMTLLLGFSCLPDSFYAFLFNYPLPYSLTMPAGYEILVYAILLLVIYLSYEPVKNLLSSGQLMNFSFNPLHLVNTYGAFGSVTKTRYEIIIEGTLDDLEDEEVEWKEYEFKGKPGHPKRRPPQIAPYHLRLDWQMWFAAMTSYTRNPWLVRLVRKLLDDDKATLKLLRYNPFHGNPPRFIRATLYHYRYATRKEQRETGQFWIRDYRGIYMPPVANER